MAHRLAGAWCVFADPVGRSSPLCIVGVVVAYIYLYIANILVRVGIKKKTQNKKGKKRKKFRKKEATSRKHQMGNKGEETKWRGLEFFFLPKLWEGNVDIFRMTKGGSSWFGDLNICSAERQNGFIVVWGVVVFFFLGGTLCGMRRVDR